MTGALTVEVGFTVLPASSYARLITGTGPGAVNSTPTLGTDSLEDIVAWMAAMMGLQKVTQTSTTRTVRNAADSGNAGTGSTSDDGTTFTQGAVS